MNKSKLQSFMHSILGVRFLKVKPYSDDNEYQMLKSDESKEAENILSLATIDGILDDIGLGTFHIKIFFLLGLMYAVEAVEISVLSIIIPALKMKWHISVWEEALFPLLMICGILFGASFWGWICDRWGRKPAFVGSSIWIFLSGFTSALSINFYLLSATLFLVGFGVGIEIQVFTLIEEFFPPRYRTKVSVIVCIFWTVGFLISAIVGAQMRRIGFRVMLGLVCVPMAMFLVGIAGVPESPRFCIASGNDEKALLILNHIGTQKSTKVPKRQLYKSVDIPSERGNFKQLFQSGLGKITCCLWLVLFFSYLSYYFTVFSAAEVASTNSSSKLNADAGEMNNGFSTMAWMSLPEVSLILLTALGCQFCSCKSLMVFFTLIAAVLQIIELCIPFHDKTIVLVLITLSRACMVCQSNLLFIYTCEIYPTKIRGIGVGFASSFSRLGMSVGLILAQVVFQVTHFDGTLVNICSLLLALLIIVCLPSHGESQVLG